MQKQQTFYGRVVGIVASRRFWWFVLVLFVLQAVWIAVSGKYPMAFDEDFHLGIIKLYAHHLSPFWSNQPENADRFGAVARDPSYLYQYLMSFPYRLLKLFTSDQTTIVIWLRFINVGLFAGGLAVFRKLLLKSRVNRALVHLCLLVFVLLPIVPLLAAQINYDNLVMPLVAIALLLAIRLDEALTKFKRLDAKLLLQLLTVCSLASLVKYSFLPIFVAITGFVVVRLWQKRAALGNIGFNLAVSWRTLNRRAQVGLLAAVIIAGGLFVQRIGFNFVRYHAPAPDCSQVLTREQCKEYGPWIRDYDFKLTKGPVSHSPLAYSNQWFYGMWLRTLFSLGGPETTYETRGPLLVPAIGAIIFAAIGLTSLVMAGRLAFRRYNTPVMWLLGAVSATYIVFLWVDEYLAYLRTGQPVAINGRYLLPVLLPVLLLLAASLTQMTKRRPRMQLGLAAGAVLCLLWGGGVLTFILRSNDSWYWNSPLIRSANHVIQNVLGPVTPGNYNQAQFLR